MRTFIIDTQYLENYGETEQREDLWKSKGGDTYTVTVPDSRRARNQAVAQLVQQLIVNNCSVEYIVRITEVVNDPAGIWDEWK